MSPNPVKSRKLNVMQQITLVKSLLGYSWHNVYFIKFSFFPKYDVETILGPWFILKNI